MDFHIVEQKKYGDVVVAPLSEGQTQKMKKTQEEEFVNMCAVCHECTHTESICHMYKTKLCWFVNRPGGCRNGPGCIFAHVKSEIREAPSESQKFYEKPPREKHLRNKH